MAYGVYYMIAILKLIGVLILFWSTQSCQLPTVFDCNSTEPYCLDEPYIESLPQTIYNCSEPLDIWGQSFLLQGTFSSIAVYGSNVEVGNLTVKGDLVVRVSLSMSMGGNIVVGGRILVHSNISLNGTSDLSQEDSGNNQLYSAEITIQSSVVECQKLVLMGVQDVTVADSSIQTSYSLCLYNSIDVSGLSKNVSAMMDLMDYEGVGSLQFGVFLYASNTVAFLNSVVNTVSVFVVSLGDLTMVRSDVNTTGRSCGTNTGIGRGTTIQYQNTYCTSGSSSCGFGSISNSVLCADIVQYFMFLSHSFPYISKGPYLSTGSGGYGYAPADPRSGAGGGLVFILVEDTLEMEDANIEASGGSVGETDLLSGGSGGTIFMSCNQLVAYGNSNVSAAGGNSTNNNGSGAGGMVKISYKDGSIDTNGAMLWVNINEGVQSNDDQISIYSNGIFYGVNCQPGQQANYLGCDNCPPGFYSSLGDPICRQCPHLEQVGFNMDSKGNDAIYKCYKIGDDSFLADWFTPGSLSLLSILLYLVFLILLTIVGAVLKKRIKKEKLASGEDFKIEEVKRDIEQAKILALELRQSKNIKSYELMYHVHRISCFGSNSEQSPWVLPLTVPQEMRRYVHAQVFRQFAMGFNEEARWGGREYWLTKAALLVYPLYWWWLDRVKKRKYARLTTRFEHAKDYNLLNNYGYEDRSILTIKFSKTKDYSNCYLDFFVYQRADIRYFTLASPFLVYFSGEGSFLRPFYLQEDDIFYRMMFFVVSRDISPAQSSDERSRLFSNMLTQKKRQKNSQQIVRFLRKLNTIACTLDLAGPQETVISGLWRLAEFLQIWNREFFSLVAVQVDLLIMISRLTGAWEVDNDIQIPTTKNRDVFVHNIQRKLEENGQWEHTVKLALVVYNPQQEIPREEESQLRPESEEAVPGCTMEESIRESLMNVRQEERQQPLKRRRRSRVAVWLGRLRYYMITHERNVYDEYTIKFLQSLFILLQTMLVFIWSVKVALPYPLVNLVCPLVGVIWFVSDSYGFGKLYLILLAMTLLDEIVVLILYSALEAGSEDYLVRNIICSLVNILIIVVMMFVGKRAITLSKKLSLKKEDDNPQRKIQF